MPFAEPEERGRVGRAKGGAAVSALEPLGSGIRSPPPHKAGEAALRARRVQNGLSALGEGDLKGLVMDVALKERLNIENFRGGKSFDLTFDSLNRQ